MDQSAKKTYRHNLLHASCGSSFTPSRRVVGSIQPLSRPINVRFNTPNLCSWETYTSRKNIWIPSLCLVVGSSIRQQAALRTIHVMGVLRSLTTVFQCIEHEIGRVYIALQCGPYPTKMRWLYKSQKTEIFISYQSMNSVYFPHPLHGVGRPWTNVAPIPVSWKSRPKILFRRKYSSSVMYQL